VLIEKSLNNFITNFTDFMNFQSAHFEKKSLNIQLKDKHIMTSISSDREIVVDNNMSY
jgi:hypothetical protein